MSKAKYNHTPAEYIIAQTSQGYQVAKFQGATEPTAVYTVQQSVNEQGKFTCNCAAGIYHRHLECKHVKMIRDQGKEETTKYYR